MDTTRFDAFTRSLAAPASRRALTGGLLAAFGLGRETLLPYATSARKNTSKSKKKPLVFNALGCVNVGNACRGNSANCCSGICQGKKPKKGTKDKSRCVAHNVGSCLPGQDVFPPTPCGTNGVCAATTGKAMFCGDLVGLCADCTKDADCVETAGPGAACIIVPGQCVSTGGRSCYGPAA